MTVDELLERMSAAEFEAWQARAMRRGALGKSDWLLAFIAAMVEAKLKGQSDVDEWLPYQREAKRKECDWGLVRATFDAMARAQG